MVCKDGWKLWICSLIFNLALFEPSVYISDGSRSKIFDPGQVGSIFCGSGRVRSAIYGLG